MNKKFVPFSILLLAAIHLAGCGSDPGFNESTDFAVDEGSVQFVNLMGDSPNLTIIHGLSRTSVQFPFTSPVELRAADEYEWEIVYLNDPDEFNAESQIVVAEGGEQIIKKDSLSTFLLMGNIAQPNIQIVDHDVLPQAGRPEEEAKLWFANNAKNFSMVDVFVTAQGEDLENMTPLVTLNSGAFSDLIPVAAGLDQQIRVKAADSGQLIFDSGPIELPNKSNELFAIVDDFGPNQADHVNVIRTLSAAQTVIVDTSQTARARIANFSQFESLSASLNLVQFDEVSRLSFSDYSDIANGNAELAVRDEEIVLEESSQPGFDGNFKTVYIFSDEGDERNQTTKSLGIADDRRSVIDRAIFSFANGGNDIIDLYAVEPGGGIDDQRPLLNDFGFGASGTLEVLARPSDLVVANQNSSETLGVVSVNFIPGKTFTVIFEGPGNLTLKESP